MKIIILTLLVLSLNSAVSADSSRTIRNSDGTTSGTVTRTGNTETWRNSDGETVFTRDRDRDGSTWRNSDGELEFSEDEN